MCGTVGMFIGCAALSYCPQRLLASAGDTSALSSDAPPYHSPFRSWYDRSSVRSAPRRLLPEPDKPGAVLFPPELVPVSGHPAVRDLPEGVYDELLIRHLYRYLDFTAKLEYLVVNPAVLGIAHGSIGVVVPEEMRFDALKMYCDEAYHALFSVDLARQVQLRTGVVPSPRKPFFLSRLEQIAEELDPPDRPLAHLLFVIISETLISATLADIPAAGDVSEAVRETIRDHALDEGRHHAYFAAFLTFFWAQLEPETRRRAALLVPRLMDAFLRPDLPALREDLVRCGLSEAVANDVLDEVYRPEVVAEHMRLTSRQSRRYFQELGAFEDSEVAEKLAERGLSATDLNPYSA